MAYVVTEPCIDVKDGDCTDVCPVDCIYEGGRTFYIHPEECVNCGLCLSVCPVDAIIWDEEATPQQAPYIAINREFFEVSGIGSPGGWDKRLSTAADHPAVAQFEKSA
ncbi:ferredoxin [Oryzicola mucosus]|uniref:Ferredoxin n=1 Tax=Oryzicola mucosus TaxID=2767425 RepID=A0A8J6PTE6_9HYPH|nr:ferredoxin [Oryzicola mucosus]MBD0413836.1 ferredoxin family protein [Oryzicola mucosus]